MQTIFFRREKFSEEISEYIYSVVIGNDPQFSTESRNNAMAFYRLIDTEHWEDSVRGERKQLWRFRNDFSDGILIVEDFIE